jgi:hypothetical protein
MMYLSPMTNTTQSFDAFGPFVCVLCGCEHDYEDTIVRIDGGILCEDVAACEARGFVVDEPEDPGIDPEPDYTDEDEGEPFYCEDHTGQDREYWYD